MSDVTIKILVENTACDDDLVAEHGLSMWICCGERKILFDTAKSDAIVKNAKTLEIDPLNCDAIVLSHGHYDHCDGMAALLAAGDAKVQLFAHEDIFTERYSTSRCPKPYYVGISPEATAAIKDKTRPSYNSGPVKLFDNIYLSGHIERSNDFEDTGGNFYLDAATSRTDLIPDDQAMYIDLGSSVVVILGCAHAGVVNTLEQIKSLTGGKTVAAVIGGMHLVHASSDRMARTIDYLRTNDIRRIIACHCTGEAATAELKKQLPQIASSCNCGDSIEINGI